MNLPQNLAGLRAILYLRYSDIKQTGNTSIESQDKVGHTYCASEQMNVVDIVKNEATSADHTKQSTRVADLLEYCQSQKGKFDVLVVYKLDRFARSQEEHHWLRGQLKKMGIILRSATEKIDESPSGKLVEGVLAAVNEYDNEVRRERTRLGLIRRVEQGLWPWNPPLGYMPDRNRDPNVKLTPHVIDPNCDYEVQNVFEDYATGNFSISYLAKKYSKKQVVRHNGQVIRFSKQTIDTLLSNVYYIGMLKIKTGEQYQGNHKPLVSEQIFNKCQSVKARNGNKTKDEHRKRDNPDFPLRGFIHCGECGNPFTSQKSKKKYLYYFCFNPKCSSFRKTYPKDHLEKEFMTYLSNVKATPEARKGAEERLIAQSASIEKAIKAQSRSLENDLEQLENKKQWVMDQGYSGVFDTDTVRAEMEKIKQKKILIKADLSGLIEKQIEIEGTLSMLDDFFQTIEKAWYTAPFEQKQQLQQHIFPKGVKYSKGLFSNSKMSPYFNLIQPLVPLPSTNVTPKLLGSNFLCEVIEDLEKYKLLFFQIRDCKYQQV
ncbi:MAG: recombinase family protein [Chloroflexota bacterium]